MQILHAGTGREHRVRDMIETILHVSGASVAAQYGELSQRSDEPTTWVADIRRTTQITGWRPKFDLAGGIEKTWSWFVDHSAAYAA